jgi:hypothetical protein
MHILLFFGYAFLFFSGIILGAGFMANTTRNQLRSIGLEQRVLTAFPMTYSRNFTAYSYVMGIIEFAVAIGLIRLGG